MTKEISHYQEQQQVQTNMQSYCFSSAQNFEAAQRMATALSKATIVPKEYQNNLPNCIIALEVAHRMGASPTMVMQNLYIVHGKPSWSSQFVISAINTCGRFRPLRFEMGGKEGGEDRSCIAWTLEKEVKLPSNVQTLADARKAGLPILESPRISIELAKAEGWYQKSGSKWKTIPDLMLRYRSASFFGRLYAPEVLMGMHTDDEVKEMTNVTPPRHNSHLKDAFIANADPQTGEVVEEAPVAEPEPDGLSTLLAQDTPSNDEQTIKPLLTLECEGDAKSYPDEIDSLELMQLLTKMDDENRTAFLKSNKDALNKVADYMRDVDDKPLAADNIGKYLKTLEA